MSWPLLLSRYTRSILKDNVPLVILAFLERGGLTTESQIIKQAGVEEQRAKETLFDLRMDDLIEYGSHYLRLTEKGREVLDRFQLDKETIGDILDLLRLQGEEREVYQLTLRTYRRTAYTNYLNSVSSLWALKSLSDLASPDAEGHIQEEAGLGMVILLTSDVTNWWEGMEALPVATQLHPRISDSCRTISTKFSTWAEESAKGTRVNRYVRALTGSLSGQFGQFEGPRSEQTDLEQCVMGFFEFRLNSEPDRWFDQWTELKLNIPMTDHSKPGYHLGEINRLLSQTVGKNLFLASNKDPERWKKPTDNPPRWDTLFENLLVSQSIDELIDLSGMPRQRLKALLEQIEKKCRAIIESDTKIIATP